MSPFVPTASDYWMLYVTLLFEGIVTAYAIYSFVYVYRNSKFKWVQFMLFLCVLENPATMLWATSMYLEVTPWHETHQWAEAFFIGATVFLFYVPSNVMYWLFGWKYWVIAIEVPALVNEQSEEIDPNKPVERKKRFWTERRYNILNWFGILVNFGFCAWLAWVRGKRDFMMCVNGGAPASLLWAVLYVYFSCTGLLLISAGFLGDALRRLKKQFNKDKRLALNYGTMTLHVSALFLHTVFMLYNQYMTFYTFMHKQSNRNKMNVSRILLHVSNSISQAIVIYLFVQFACPVSLKKQTRDSDYEEELDRVRDPNLDMVYYVKNMPKMRRNVEEDYDLEHDKSFTERMFTEVDAIEADARIDGFTDRMTEKWGEEETQLRLAIYISFVKD
jgi:hypothetical protein